MRLSRLQKTILALGLENVEGYVTAAAVKSRHYGFPLRRRGRTFFFDRSEIGHARYNVVAVTIANSFNRLAQRGLAVRLYTGEHRITKNGVKHYCGIRLTERGLAAARKIASREMIK